MSAPRERTPDLRPIVDEELILFLYGEMDPDTAHRLGERIEADDTLRNRYEALSRTLDLVDEGLPVPEPTAGWEGQVWQRLAPRLRSRRSRLASWLHSWLPSWLAEAAVRRWAQTTVAAALVAALVTVGFLAGRWDRGDDPAPAFSPEARQRILDGALAAHLDSSQRLLTSLANAEDPADLAAEREWASALLLSNRLYRQAAERAGQRRIAALLAELEPVLLEMAHLPSDLAEADTEQIQRRIERRDLLFKVRVAGKL